IDTVLHVVAKLDNDIELLQRFKERIAFLRPGSLLVLVTGHIRERSVGGFERICYEIVETTTAFAVIENGYSVHFNPRESEPVNRLLAGIGNIHLIEPLDYLPFVYLMNRAHLILTDSGGIQEEAPSLGKPVLVMRDTTERPEAVEAGTVKLVGTDIAAITSG